MFDGEKSISEKIFYQAMDRIEEKTKQDPQSVFEKAMDNVKPILEVRSRRVGGATYQVPVEVKSNRQMALAIRWIINYSRDRKESSMVDKLAAEIIDASNNQWYFPSKREKIPIRWLKLTRLLLTTDGSFWFLIFSAGGFFTGLRIVRNSWICRNELPG